MVRGLERRPAPAAARRGRPAPRGRCARPLRALRARTRPTGRMRVGALRRHFAFRQDTRLALDLRVRPSRRGRGLGGSLLVQLLARARELRAGVIRAYAPEDDAAWRALAARHFMQEVECDRYLLLEVRSSNCLGRPGSDGAYPGRRAERCRARGLAARAACCTPRSPPARPTSLRASASGGRACSKRRAAGPETVLVTRAPDGALAGICALRICSADPGDRLPRVHGRRGRGARAGPRPGAQAGGDRMCARSGVHRLVADTSPANTAMLALNERLGYRAVLDVRNLEGSP